MLKKLNLCWSRLKEMIKIKLVSFQLEEQRWRFENFFCLDKFFQVFSCVRQQRRNFTDALLLGFLLQPVVVVRFAVVLEFAVGQSLSVGNDLSVAAGFVRSGFEASSATLNVDFVQSEESLASSRGSVLKNEIT